MTSTQRPVQSAPLNDATIVAISQLVDDAQSERRDPSHSDIEHLINLYGLSSGDPNAQGQRVGKTKRVSWTLNWAMEHNLEGGESFLAHFISLIKGHGGFRAASRNYVGSEAIQNAVSAFKTDGFILTDEGDLFQELIDNLSGDLLTEELKRYVNRAKRGVSDAALLVGTGKDLLEATAAHIIVERYGSYSTSSNFPTLLGQAFTYLNMTTSADARTEGENPLKTIDRSFYEIGCAVNRMRNQQGTGHGRPWPVSMTDEEARRAVEMMGIIAERLLQAHEQTR